MMNPIRVSYLVRFSERQFLEDFIENGTIYMNTIGHFKSIEEHVERSDVNENITGYFQPGNVKIKYGDRQLKDFVGPITIYDPSLDKFHASHIFCMTYLLENYIPREDRKIFDDRMINFGSLTLIKPTKFLKKMTEALDKLKQESKIYNYSYGLVEYVSKDTYSGDMNPFRKTDDYAHQQEFRFVVSAVDRSAPLIFKLGNLEGIALGIDTGKLENRVEIDPNGNVTLIFN